MRKMAAHSPKECQPMIQILAVAAGGAVGSVLRYLISRISFLSAFPWSTLLVNLADSFIKKLRWIPRSLLGGGKRRFFMNV